MEVKDKWKDQRGFATIFIFMGILFILITFFLIGMEYYRVSNLYDQITTEMDRASNIAVEYAMVDEARGYHISTIDVAEAQKQFDAYFKERLDLTSDYCKYDDSSNLRYKIVFDRFKIDGEAPEIELAGKIYVELQLISGYVTAPIGLSFHEATDNVNIVD